MVHHNAEMEWTLALVGIALLDVAAVSGRQHDRQDHGFHDGQLAEHRSSGHGAQGNRQRYAIAGARGWMARRR
jgi:hypothetical protein